MAKVNALSQRIQDWILYYAATDTSFLQMIRDSVKAEYFNPITSEYIDICYRHLDQTGRAPRVFFTELSEQFIEALPRPDRNPNTTYLEKVFSAEVPDQDDIIAKLAEFVQAKAMENGILSAASMLDTGDISNCKFVLSTALESSFNVVDNVSELVHGDFRFAFDERKIICKTGFPVFDKRILGWMRKQFVFFIAGTKVGKSWCLCHMAKTAMKSGSNVLYITHEITKAQVEERMFMMFGALANEKHPDGIYIDVNGPDGYKRIKRPSVCDYSRIIKAQKMMRRKQYGKMFIKEYPYASASQNDINACIDRTESKHNVRIDVVVNDYADIMKLPKGDEHRHKLAEIYRWHRTLASQRDILVMSVSQTNRGAQDRESIGIKDIAEDFQKTQIADAVVTLTAKQKVDNEMIAQLALNRGDVQGMKCGILRNYNIGQFMIKSWEIEDDDNDDEEERDGDSSPLFGDRYKK